ncbi:IS1 family transposase [Gloeomargarita sp.]
MGSISKSWLHRYTKYVVAYTAESLDVAPHKDGELELEWDEVWSFMGSKQNPQWLWLALEKTMRLIVAACIGDRSIETAKKLWRRLPRVWRNQAKFYTDFWQAYREVMPLKPHERVSQGRRKTSYIERFNNTLRQRIGRLARKTLSFSKNLENHIGIIFNFIHHYNEALLG